MFEENVSLVYESDGSLYHTGCGGLMYEFLKHLPSLGCKCRACGEEIDLPIELAEERHPDWFKRNGG